MAKVGLTGTSCVGKSTLLRRVQTRLGAQCITVEEAARDYFRRDPNHLGAVYDPALGDRFSYAVQRAIQLKHMNRMADASSRADGILEGRVTVYRHLTKLAIVEDRTPFDAAVYVAANGDRTGAENLLNEALWWAGPKPYDHLYLLDPTDIPYVADAERTEPPAVRARIHQTFLDFFAEHDIPYTLLGGAEEERTANVLDDIQAVWTAGVTQKTS